MRTNRTRYERANALVQSLEKGLLRTDHLVALLFDPLNNGMERLRKKKRWTVVYQVLTLPVCLLIGYSLLPLCLCDGVVYLLEKRADRIFDEERLAASLG